MGVHVVVAVGVVMRVSAARSQKDVVLQVEEVVRRQSILSVYSFISVRLSTFYVIY